MINKLLAAAGLAVAISLATSGAQADTTSLFSDGFESGNFSVWTSAGSGWATVLNTINAHSGNRRAEVKGILTGSALTADLAEISGPITLSYWYKIASGLESTDHVHVQWSVNGSDWNTLADYTAVAAGTWTQETFTFSPASSNVTIRFSATFDTATSDVFDLDDVSATQDVTTPTPTVTPTATPTPTLTPTPTVTPTPGPTPTPTPVFKNHGQEVAYYAHLRNWLRKLGL